MTTSRTHWGRAVPLLFLACLGIAGCKIEHVIDCKVVQDGEVRHIYFIFYIDNQTSGSVDLSVRPYDNYHSIPEQWASLLPPRGLERREQKVAARTSTTEKEILILESPLSQSNSVMTKLFDPPNSKGNVRVCSFVFGVKRAGASSFAYYSGRRKPGSLGTSDPVRFPGFSPSSAAGYNKGIVEGHRGKRLQAAILLYTPPPSSQDDGVLKKRVPLFVFEDEVKRPNPAASQDQDRCSGPKKFLFRYKIDTLFAIYDVTITDTDVQFSVRNKKESSLWARDWIKKNRDYRAHIDKTIIDHHDKDKRP